MTRIGFEECFRWSARVWSIASLVFLCAFIFGDVEQSEGWPTAVEWIGLAFFPLGVIAGLLLGWWRERLGGSLSVLSLVGFYVWYFVVSNRFAAGGWFIVLAAPGALFLIAGWLQQRNRRSGRNSPPNSRNAFHSA